jgi:hypothetical protein
MQLVKTLLKQAGFDKRTGDLFGNRDLFIKALNMARGLKVCPSHLETELTSIFFCDNCPGQSEGPNCVTL